MTLRTLIRRSLRFHWRAHLGVVLGAAIGSAALIGALVVGDSVRGSLRERALQRLGEIRFTIHPGDRFFTDTLADRLPCDLKDNWRVAEGVYVYVPGGAAAALVLPGVATSQNGGTRANRVLVHGVRQLPEADRPNHYYELWSYAHWHPRPFLAMGEILLNEPLARQLAADLGAEVVLRIRKPGALTGEASIAQRAEQSVSLRLRVTGIVPATELGDFSLHPTATPPLNAFVNLEQLQQATDLPGRANLIVTGPVIEVTEVQLSRLEQQASQALDQIPAAKVRSVLRTLLAGNERAWQERPAAAAREELQHELGRSLGLADAEGALAVTPAGEAIELKSRRVFLESPLASPALAADITAQPLLTYLVNLISAGTNATPYSMVTAAGTPWTPTDMRDDEILVSQWLADDLQVKTGDEISLVYFDPESGARLVERTNSFRVRAIVPMEMPWADRTLMPDFPGIEKAESTSDWDAGFPLVHRIRDKDEEYWKQHRGTPKAFITLAAGQKMWANRFGDLTAIRFPIPTNTLPLTPALSPGERESHPQSQNKTETGAVATHPEQSRTGQTPSPLPAGEGQSEGETQAGGREGSPLHAGTNATGGAHGVTRSSNIESYCAALEKKILANLKPEELGLRFEPVREQALKAAEESQDFGGLFLGFSFFLIIAALLLMAMLFQFGLEQRTSEIGTLLALGFTPKQVRRLLLGEGVALAFIGGVLGAVGGLAYARAMLHGLTTIWRDAVGASALSFHATPQTLAIGLFAATLVGAITIRLALRKFVRRSARELLVGEVEVTQSNVRSLKSKVIAVAALLAAVALAGWAVVTGDTANAGAFFGAGALVLIAGLSFVSAWLTSRTGVAPVSDSAFPSDGDRRDACPTLSSLALNGCARRRTRSLATVAMLACGSFLIVSIGVFRLDANREASKRTSGTGGFALIGETTMPVVHDVNTESGRDFFALMERDLAGVSFVPFRVREGDEASCLNLNRAQKPRLLGVKPELLEGRFGFAKGAGWTTLNSEIRHPNSETEIPAIGDANSIQWAMKKKVGDTIDYVDERGQAFQVRIVGAVANSILQGQLIIDEAAFVKRFPGESGYRMFLIDAPSNRVAEVSATLSRAMQDVGLELTPAAQRLAQFNAVQNTYLGTFQVLGGLGLLLGSVGLGIVVLRNVLERRGELALLMAVGFRQPLLQRLLLIENGALLALGLALGVAAAAVAVLPAWLSPAAQLPVTSLALTLAAVLLNGALWTWAATRFALRGDLLAALRNE